MIEQRIEGLVPDKSRRLVVYCSAGNRAGSMRERLCDSTAISQNGYIG